MTRRVLTRVNLLDTRSQPLGWPAVWSKGQIDMNKIQAGLGGISGAVGIGVAVIAVLAVAVWFGTKDDRVDVTTPTALVQPEGEAPAEPPAETAKGEDAAPKTESVMATDNAPVDPEVTTDNAEPPQIAPPAFDEVRREPDGMTVVAGRAAPDAIVQVLRDGEVIGVAIADGSGKFATLVIVAPDGEGHVLSLSQSVDGVEIASLDEIILAPTTSPVAVAEVAPEVLSETPQVEPLTVDPDTNAPSAVTAENTTVQPETVQTAPSEGVAEPITAPATEAAQVTAAETPDVAVLKSTAEGVELLNPAAPELMASVALDTISYSDAGDVQLAGRAQPETQTVRVYLDNDAVIDLPVDEQGRWRGNVPNVDEGIYTLRVDEVGADGSVTSRVETPFKRESAAALAQATAGQEGPIKAITVQTGATLWAIARDRYGDGRLYVRVFEANKSDIRDPDLIYPGQIFDLPD